jgi:hypothetical protein
MQRSRTPVRRADERNRRARRALFERSSDLFERSSILAFKLHRAQSSGRRSAAHAVEPESMVKKTIRGPRVAPSDQPLVPVAKPVDVAARRCQVCEWQGDLIESEGDDPDCPWCHGPTERIATLATSPGTGGKNPHAAALGRLGGLKGGRARAKALTPSQRRKIASRAAKARWDKRKAEGES